MDPLYIAFSVPVLLVVFIAGRWPLYWPVWRERIGRWFGLTLLCALLLLSQACQAAGQAQAAAWFDRAMTSVCAAYPVLLRPRVLEIADSAPPEPAADPADGGVEQ